MIVDGKAIAKDVELRVRRHVERMRIPPTLALVYGGNNDVQQQYLAQKEKLASRLGVMIRRVILPARANTQEASRLVKEVAENPVIQGIVIQLPLPEGIDEEQILRSVPKEKDIDVLSPDARGLFRQGTFPVLPPVAGAIHEICRVHKVKVGGKHAVVIGHGRLVGAPVALWLRHNDAEVTVVGEPVKELGDITKTADIIVLGTGKPNMLRPEMVRDGVMIFDAGTSDVGGAVRGDADRECSRHAALFTPVPHGIGPVAIAMLFQNLVVLSTQRK